MDSLAGQTEKDIEIIVVDDGSTDSSKNFATLSENHKGPGAARNLGAKKAKGAILVFVDADMEFAPNFIEKLTTPIKDHAAIGTYSKEEFLLNKNKPLARCWNLNLDRDPLKMEPRDYVSTGWKSKIKSIYKNFESKNEEIRSENEQHVFRAILKSEFEKAGGFDENVGYTDDWSIARKLGTMAKNAPGAKFYHRNPETLDEVWSQARWFGKNEFLTKNLIRKLFNLTRYNPITGILFGLFGMVKYKEPQFLIFKIVYDTAIFTSVLMSFINEPKFK